MELKLQPYYLLLFSIAFLFCTVIGTVTHEFGHIVVAKFLGYETTLHYSSMSYDKVDRNAELIPIYTEYRYEIENDLQFPRKKEYESIIKKIYLTDPLLIKMGGPFQTILTGLIGLLMLYFRKEKIKKNGFKLFDWIAVFLSLFWLREVFNLVMSISSGIFDGSYFGGDEAKISKILEIPTGTIPIILGVLGLLVSLYIVFKVIPKEKRFDFIIAGFIGGISGYILWMNIIGPRILP
ncbi:MAG: hypothetical protein K9H64_06515 [Bacteroidales bacterium]|nr:hypothetical protein [Bacteroidales bacterium]MCF8455350.1 hypothetical protein [Bacteroidales bacterium]